MNDERPNILLISTDQQRADHLGCYGAKGLKTPHIDSLAARGTRYERAYVASPVCMPNRSSIVTGRMPSLHGVRHNGLNLALESRTFVDVLRDAGYRTSLSGKAHLQCVTMNAAALCGDRDRQAIRTRGGRYDQELGPLWRENPSRSMDLPYYGFEHVDLAVGHGDQVDGHYNQWVADQGADLESLRGPDNAQPTPGCPLFQSWRTRVPEELYPTRYIQTMTEAALSRYAKDSTSPFFHWASFCDPHHPFTPPGRYWDRYAPEDVELPASFASRAQGSWGDVLAAHRRDGQANLTGTSAIAATERELRWATALTYGLISMVDDAVGSILEALQANDQSRNTVVIFLSDHGDLMGDHGLVFKGPYHYQSVIRMPLIWFDPRDQASKVCDELVSVVDVSASILDSCGATPYEGMNGRSLVAKDNSSGRDAILIEDEIQASMPGTRVRGRARTLVTAQWRFSVFDGIDRGELFDLVNDPTETQNLWDEHAYKAVRADLLEQLVRQMLAHTETGVVPEFAA